MKNKTILFVDHDFGISGSTVSLKYITQKFISEGWIVYILTSKEKDKRAFFNLPEERFFLFKSNKFFSMVLILHIARWSGRFSFSWITNITKNIIRLIIGLFISYKVLKKIKPDIVYVNEYVVFQASIIAKLLKIKTVLHVRSQFVNMSNNVIKKMIANLLYYSSDKIIAITGTEANQFKNRDKVIVVPEFLNEDNFNEFSEDSIITIKKKFEIPSNKKIVLMMGGIDKIKGTLTFLESYIHLEKEFSDVIYILLGGKINNINENEADYYIKVSELLEQFDKKIIYVGATNLILEYLSIADIIVSPQELSHFSRPVIEAWAQKKPVITTNLVHSLEYMKDGEDSLFFDVGNSAQLAEKILCLLKSSNLKDKLALNGYEKAISNYNSENALNIIVKQCESI